MESLGFAVITAGLLGLGLISARLAGSPVTPPMIFVLFGFSLGPTGLGLIHININHEGIQILAEATLAVILFSDAARIDLRKLSKDHNLPARMLSAGMPLTIIAGTAIGLALLPVLSFWEAALLAALLTPTDAALGQAVISDKDVPIRLRQAINVESGLNDGIALPAVLVIATCAAAAHGDQSTGYWALFALLQLGVSPVIGVAVGLAGGWAIDRAVRRGWMNETFEGLGALALVGLAVALAQLINANAFIAAFTAGLGFGRMVGYRCTFLFRFAEAEGQLLALATFFIFGALLLPDALAVLDHWVALYALLSLTIVRMIPTSLALARTGLKPATHAFLGWFGPRGIATILFAMLVVDRAAIPHKDTIIAIAMAVVGLSVLAHGASAAPAARWYARWSGGLGECGETRRVSAIPFRFRNDGDE